MTIDFDDVAHKGITTITPDDVAVAQKLGYVIKLVVMSVKLNQVFQQKCHQHSCQKLTHLLV